MYLYELNPLSYLYDILLRRYLTKYMFKQNITILHFLKRNTGQLTVILAALATRMKYLILILTKVFIQVCAGFLSCYRPL